MKSVFWSVAALLLTISGLCSGQVLIGAGATFPYPVYSQWFHDFREARPGMSVNYQSVGSGAGIRQLMAGVVDFGASDMPMTDEQLAGMKSAGLKSGLQSNVLHFPTVMGGVVPIYNLGPREYHLKFTPEILAGIFLGKIMKWNDPRICEVNPGVELPPETIRPVHRSDGSGTTFVFTDFLSKTVPEWKAGVGSGTMVKWPGGDGEKGSEGIAGRTRHSAGSIGYVELAYALRNGLAYGSVRNSSGAFVLADMNSVTAAAADVAMPEDFRVSITNAPGVGAYPISTFTWLLVPETVADPARGKALRTLLRWALTKGQAECTPLGYAPLPREVVRKEWRQIALIH
ncbi:MAG TPA: phosphate ABC transporter substrate-binding protein PstS [Bryobacteraceae bacterium]|jgi:phosphate transport system substrate-binding protein|nr:phosphate ABC transporter substrate-binding protein PstS [Bryobacteraceae bacterium]